MNDDDDDDDDIYDVDENWRNVVYLYCQGWNICCRSIS